MKSIFINNGIAILSNPVLLILKKTIHNAEVLNNVSWLWIGICLTCLVNGIVSYVKFLRKM